MQEEGEDGVGEGGGDGGDEGGDEGGREGRGDGGDEGGDEGGVEGGDEGGVDGEGGGGHGYPTRQIGFHSPKLSFVDDWFVLKFICTPPWYLQEHPDAIA